MNRISVCLITLNEEHNLPRALASLAGIADEIIIVDAGSTDRTPEIAQEQGATLFSRPWTNYAEQKNFAAEQAANEWVFSMDADEELSSLLHTSLLDWKKRKPEHAVYEVARKTWYLGAWIKHSGWYPDFQRRLYRRDAAQFSGIIHESLRFDGKPGPPERRPAALHGPFIRRTPDQCRALLHARRAADVRQRQAPMARRGLVRHALELVSEFRAARWLPGRLSRRIDRTHGRPLRTFEIH